MTARSELYVLATTIAQKKTAESSLFQNDYNRQIPDPVKKSSSHPGRGCPFSFVRHLASYWNGGNVSDVRSHDSCWQLPTPPIRMQPEGQLSCGDRDNAQA